MILPDKIADALFDLCRYAESPEARKILRQFAADIRAACVAQRSEILRPMAAARVAEWN